MTTRVGIELDRVSSLRLGARSLRTIATTESDDRELALEILNIAAKLERKAFEIEGHARTWRRSLASV